MLELIYRMSYGNKRKDGKMKRQVIYYKENGEVDKFATYINNHDWVIPVVVVVSVILVGLIEGM